MDPITSSFPSLQINGTAINGVRVRKTMKKQMLQFEGKLNLGNFHNMCPNPGHERHACLTLSCHKQVMSSTYGGFDLLMTFTV